MSFPTSPINDQTYVTALGTSYKYVAADTAWKIVGSNGGGTGTGTVLGSGTSPYIPVWTDSSNLGDSVLHQDSTKSIHMQGNVPLEIRFDNTNGDVVSDGVIGKVGFWAPGATNGTMMEYASIDGISVNPDSVYGEGGLAFNVSSYLNADTTTAMYMRTSNPGQYIYMQDKVRVGPHAAENKGSIDALIHVYDTTNVTMILENDVAVTNETIGQLLYKGYASSTLVDATIAYGAVTCLNMDGEGAGRLDLGIAARGNGGNLTPGLSVTSYKDGPSLPTVGIGAAAGAVQQEAILKISSHRTDVNSWRMATNIGAEYIVGDTNQVVNEQDWTRAESCFTVEDSGYIGVGADMTVVKPNGNYFVVGTGYIYGSANNSGAIGFMNFSFDAVGITSIAQQGDMSNSDFPGKLCVITEKDEGNNYSMLHVKNNTNDVLSMGYTIKYFHNIGGL